MHLNFGILMQKNVAIYSVCINLVDALDGYVDLEEVFPKDKYQH